MRNTFENMRGRYQFGDHVVDGMIILKRILKERM
jgi:hypothetical protein